MAAERRSGKEGENDQGAGREQEIGGCGEH